MTVRSTTRSGSTRLGGGRHLVEDRRPEEPGEDLLDRALRTQPLPQVPGRAVFPVAPAPAPRTLVDIVMETVSSHPDAVALDDGTTVLGYA